MKQEYTNYTLTGYSREEGLLVDTTDRPAYPPYPPYRLIAVGKLNL